MFDQVLNTSLHFLVAKAHRMSTKRSTKSSFCEFKNSYCVILPHISTIGKDKLKNTSHSNTSQVTESDSNNCNFRDALIAPVIGLFHGIPFFTQQTVSLWLPFVYQVDPYFVNSIDMCNTNEIIKTGIYIQKKHEKIIFFF